LARMVFERPVSERAIRRGEEILKKMVETSGGAIEAALVVGEDGLPIIQHLPSNIDADALSACTLALVGALDSALSLLGSAGFVRLDVRLEDDSHLVITPIGDNNLLVVKTRKSPNLGLVYLLIGKFSAKISQVIEEMG